MSDKKKRTTKEEVVQLYQERRIQHVLLPYNLSTSSADYTDYITSWCIPAFITITIILRIGGEVAMGIFAGRHSPAQVIVPLHRLSHVLFPTLIHHFTDSRECSCQSRQKKRVQFVLFEQCLLTNPKNGLCIYFLLLFCS